MLARYLAMVALLTTPALTKAWCSDTTYNQSLSTGDQEAVAALSQVDQVIYTLKGREIGGVKVREVEHLAHCAPSSLADAKTGCCVNLFNATIVDARAGFAEFQTPASLDQRDLPRIEFSMTADEDDVGHVFVLVFNVYSFENRFSHDMTLTVGNEKRSDRRTKGLGDGNHRIPRHFHVDSKGTITAVFQPAVDSRWWFGSCDVYRLHGTGISNAEP